MKAPKAGLRWPYPPPPDRFWGGLASHRADANVGAATSEPVRDQKGGRGPGIRTRGLTVPNKTARVPPLPHASFLIPSSTRFGQRAASSDTSDPGPCLGVWLRIWHRAGCEALTSVASARALPTAPAGRKIRRNMDGDIDQTQPLHDPLHEDYPPIVGLGDDGQRGRGRGLEAGDR